MPTVGIKQNSDTLIKREGICTQEMNNKRVKASELAWGPGHSFVVYLLVGICLQMQDVDFMLHQLIADSAFFICYSQVPVSNIVTSSVITPYPVNNSFIYDPVPILIQLAYALYHYSTAGTKWHFCCCCCKKQSFLCLTSGYNYLSCSAFMNPSVWHCIVASSTAFPLVHGSQDRGTELSVWYSSQIRRMLPPGPV